MSNISENSYPYSKGAEIALGVASNEARSFNHNYVGTEHLLLGVLGPATPWSSRVLSNLGLPYQKAKSAVNFIIGMGDRVIASDSIPRTPRSNKVIEIGVRLAKKRGEMLDTADIVYGIVEEGEGIAVGIIESFGLDASRLKDPALLRFIRLSEAKAGFLLDARSYKGSEDHNEYAARVIEADSAVPVVDQLLSGIRERLLEPNFTSGQREMLISGLRTILQVARNPNSLLENQD